MNHTRRTVLLIEDILSDVRLIKEYVQEPAAGHINLVHCERTAEALTQLSQRSFDAILLDLARSGSQGVVTLRHIQYVAPDTPVILLSSANDTPRVVEALRAGAQDYLPKNELNGRVLAWTIEHAIDRHHVMHQAQTNEADPGSIIDDHSDAIIVVDEDSVIHRANRAAEAMLARSADDMVGETLDVSLGTDTPVELEIHRSNGHSARSVELEVIEPNWRGTDLSLVTLRDITVRKELERRLQFYADILSNVHDGIVVTNLDGRIVYWNTGATEIFGYAADEMIGKSPAVLHPTMSHEDIQTAIRPMLDTEDFVGIRQGRHKDGSAVWVELNLSVVYNSDDQPVGFVSLAKDVTERRKAEEALKQSEAFNRSVLRSISAHVAVIDLQGTIVSTNRAWDVFSVENQGHPASTGPGVNYLDVCRRAVERGDTQVLDTIAGIERVLAGEIQHFSIQYPCHSPDEERWFLMHAMPLGGAQNGAVISHENITEQVAAARKLQESEQRYKSLFDYNPDAVYSLDLDGHFISANAALEHIIGYSAADVKGASFEPFIVPEYLEKTRHHFEQAVRGTPQNYTSAGRHRDGRRIELDITNLPIIVDDEIVGVFGIAKDITEQVHTEQRLRDVSNDLQERIKELNCLFTISDLISRQGISLDILLQRIVEQIPLGWQYTAHTCARIRLAGKVFTSDPFQASEFRQSSDIIVDGDTVGSIEVFCFDIACGPDDSPFLVEEYSLLDTIAARIAEAVKQRRADHALRESEARYRLLAENATDVISRHAPDGTYLYASPACRTLLGYTPDELVGTNAYDYFHPNDAYAVMESYTDADERGIHTVTYRVRRKDGEYVWFETTSSQIRDPETGEIREIIATSRDVTERHHRERKLEAIVTVARALREASTHEDMPPIIIEQLRQSLPVTGAALVLWDNVNKTATVECVYARAPFSAGQQLYEHTIISQVIATGESVLYNNLDTNQHADTLTESVAAIACVPLLANKRILGAIWCSRDSTITEQDLRLISAIADIGASAVNRSILHEQTERRMQRLTALRNIDMAVATSVDVNVTLNVLLDQARNELDAAAVSVLLMEESRQSLSYRAGRGFRTDEITRVDIGLHQDGAGRAARQRETIEIIGQEAIKEAFDGYRLIEDEWFSSYYASPLITKGQVRGVLEVFRKDEFIPDHEWVSFLETLASQAAIAIDNASMFEDLQRSNAELRQAYDATIEGWSRALELRDEETKGHTQRVTDLTVALARAMGVDRKQLVHMRRGALLHDIGKIGIPDRILLKNGPLNDKEWEIMKQHPIFAYEKLAPIDFLRPALDIPYSHHEKWDGSGYPRGLTGEQIPLAARIFAVVDVYDALTSDRPYRDAWTEEKAIAHIREQAGKHFDPRVVDHFLELIQGDLLIK